MPSAKRRLLRQNAQARSAKQKMHEYAQNIIFYTSTSLLYQNREILGYCITKKVVRQRKIASFFVFFDNFSHNFSLSDFQENTHNSMPLEYDNYNRQGGVFF